MGKKIQIVSDDKRTFLFLDMSDIKSVVVEQFQVVDENQKVSLFYRATGVTSLGNSYVLVKDVTSNKPDKVLSWVNDNWVKQ